MKIAKLITNRCIRLFGNICKTLSYPFHWVLPNYRFTIPEYSPAKLRLSKQSAIPRVIWQTNFSNKCALPVYLNYLFNRLMSLSCDYHYVSTEARDEYMKANTTPELYEAFSRLKNGAAQADLWRLVVLNKEGGVYADIDATFVWPLNRIIGNEDNAIFIKISNNTRYTNYFIASSPNNHDLQQAIELVIDNINHFKPEMGVYYSTGPGVLDKLFENRNDIHHEDRKYVCIQGTFTNEHFQYIDRPRTKWIHVKPEDLIQKKDD
ncbi:glycosyltransferase family 32 protein [Vibrio salinus]|uniref:glycosyltransferase family 32 protein n=1 Tax=Vibrio salinus TaxID=2899784 RepID=UPI001E529D01|nr:glycosyltransferase [Vibrio salinus]MCE0493753.1 glycosyl transferase [Vibrio salinus]